MGIYTGASVISERAYKAMEKPSQLKNLTHSYIPTPAINWRSVELWMCLWSIREERTILPRRTTCGIWMGFTTSLDGNLSSIAQSTDTVG